MNDDGNLNGNKPPEDGNSNGDHANTDKQQANSDPVSNGNGSRRGHNLKQYQFKKGDPRINRRGRPPAVSVWDELARLIEKKFFEVKAKGKNGEDKTVRVRARKVLAEQILNQMMKGNSRVLKEASDRMYGRVPLHLTGKFETQTSTVTPEDQLKVEAIKGMSDEQRRELADAMIANLKHKKRFEE